MIKFLTFIDKPFLRPFLTWFIFFNYIRKGIKVQQVKYNRGLEKWYYKVDNISFLSTGAGWAYSFDFLLNELKNISCYYYLPKSGDTVIDLGAGIGEETILFSKLVGDSGKVFSIEAHPDTFRSLDYIIKDNKQENVFLFNCAISDEDGIIKIEDNPEGYLGNSILSTSGSKNYFEVTGFKMDTFILKNKINKVDFLKVNIEGAEQLIIKGMEEFVNILHNGAISCHDFRYENGEEEFFKTRELVVRYFKEKGFAITTRQTGNSLLDNYIYISRK